jgi:hypothetical protein
MGAVVHLDIYCGLLKRIDMAVPETGDGGAELIAIGHNSVRL